jgi:hypothetical protein
VPPRTPARTGASFKVRLPLPGCGTSPR